MLFRIMIFAEVTVERVQAFATDFISRLRFQWLFFGNLSPEVNTFFT